MNYGNLSSYHPNWSRSAMYDSPSYILPVSVSYTMCNERAHKPRGEAPSFLLLYLIIFIKIPFAWYRGMCLLAPLKLCPFIWHWFTQLYPQKKIPLFLVWRGVFFYCVMKNKYLIPQVKAKKGEVVVRSSDVNKRIL